jgi:hypothetical protein
MWRLCKRLLTWMGIDPRGFTALARAFLLTDLRGQHYARATASKPGSLISPLFWVIGQCLALSAGVSLLLFARVDVFFFALANLSVGSLVLAATLVVEFNEIVLEPGDLEVLGHRPVAARTYAAARYANLLGYLGLSYLALHLFPLLLGAGLRDAGPWYVPAYLLASLTGHLAVAAVVILALSLGGLSGRLGAIKDTLAWVQILLLLVLAYGAQMVLRDETQAFFYWAAFPPPWVEYVPVAWLAHFVEEASAPGGDGLRLAPGLAGVALAACAITYARLARLYRAMQPVTPPARARPMPADRVGQVGGRRMSWLVGRSEERVGFWLCRTLLAREPGLRLRCLWPLNMAAAVVVLGLLTGQFANPLPQRDPRLIVLPITAVYLVALAVPVVVHNLAFSRDHPASWLLVAAPLEQPAGVARGVCKAVMALVVAPLCVLLGAVMTVAWADPLAALLHAGLAWALAWPLALLTLWLVIPDLPFALPQARGGTLGPLAVPLAVLGSGAMLWAALHCLFADSPWFWAASLALCLAACRPLRRQADRRLNRLWRERP